MSLGSAVAFYRQHIMASEESSGGGGSTLTVHFFALSGDTYAVLGEEAEELCRALYRPLSSIDDTQGTQTLSVSASALASALRECLFVQGWRVDVYGQSSGNWVLQRSASPGNPSPCQDLLASSGSEEEGSSVAPMLEANVAAVCFGHDHSSSSSKVGIAVVSGFELTLLQFDDYPMLLNTEAALVQLSVKEIIYHQTASAAAQIDRLRLIANAMKIILNQSDKRYKSLVKFDTEGGQLDLLRLLKSRAEADLVSLQLQSNDLALKSLCALCSFMGLLESERSNQYSLRPHQLSMYMRLDECALRSLNLFPKAAAHKFSSAPGRQQQPAGKRVDSLYGMLNRCRTGQGARLLAQWIRQPLRDVALIEQRLDVVQELCNAPNLRPLHDGLTGCADLGRMGRGRMWGGRARLSDLLVYYQVVDKTRLLCSIMSEHFDGNVVVQRAFVEPLRHVLGNLQPFGAMIVGAVDMDALDRHEYCLKAHFDEGLTEIFQKKEQCHHEMDSEHQRIAAMCGLERFKKLKLERSPVHGHCFRVSRLDANRLIKDERYIELSVQKSGIFFTTAKMRSLSAEYQELEEQYGARQSGLVSQMITSAMSYRDHFDQLNSLLALLDVSLSLAQVALTAVKPYVRPSFSSSGCIRVIGARHAMLEELTASRGPFIENDVVIQCPQKFCFITGPNMGGKSTYMRQLAIIAIMAQMGSFVPASHSAVLPVFDGVMVRVGAGDYLDRGLSTFQAEMLEMAAILHTANPNTLVIIDELGRGTSTHEGYALAAAISRHLASVINPYCLFATHFHELAQMAASHPQLFGNLRVKAEVVDGELQLQYKVEQGAADRSYGIECAKLAKLPVSVRRTAAAKLAFYEGRIRADDKSLEWVKDAIARLQDTEEENRIEVLTGLLQTAPSSIRSTLIDVMKA